MNFLSFKKNLKIFSVFSIIDIRKIDSSFDSKALVYWQKKGYIKKIINRWYYFSDADINEEFYYLIANRIYSPSYVSFETALSHYHLISEGVYTITSATSLKTCEFKTGLGVFSYRHLKPSLLFGYHLLEAGSQRIKIAEPEKALLDYLYLNEKINTNGAFEGMRINKDALLSQLNIDKLNEYLKLFSNKSLERRVGNFMQFIKKHD